jgi:hypothetical protein
MYQIIRNDPFLKSELEREIDTATSESERRKSQSMCDNRKSQYLKNAMKMDLEVRLFEKYWGCT